ncbi:MAG: MaoC family dehydratase [Pseudomonadota bacterium]
MRNFSSLQALKECVGEEVGVSDWVTMEQSRIDMFAEATGDFNWVHVDPALAAKGPFGKTIAHGFLTLSLLPLLSKTALTIDNVKLGLNYGLNKVRFPTPLLVDSRVRGRFMLLSMEDVAPIDGNPGYQITFQVTMECEGGGKPVCVAENVQRRFG